MASHEIFERLADQFDADVYRVRRSLGLIWVTQEDFHGEPGDACEHGPFMDVSDAYIQCGKPENWRVEFNA